MSVLRSNLFANLHTIITGMYGGQGGRVLTGDGSRRLPFAVRITTSQPTDGGSGRNLKTDTAICFALEIPLVKISNGMTGNKYKACYTAPGENRHFKLDFAFQFFLLL